MIGLILAIILFNIIALKMKKRLTLNQILHIWMFTIALQQSFDLIIEYKYNGYWYFDKEVDWKGYLAHTILVPPVNVMFLNWYPFKKRLMNQVFYLIIWIIAILLYEVITLMPQPWGYFHYGWWKLRYTVIVDPILFLILLSYYKFICRVETILITSK